MTDTTLVEILANTADRVIAEDDVVAMRRIVYGDDGAIDAQEMETLFAIDEAAAAGSTRWTDLFVEAGVDFLVRQRHPRGHVSQENADWLVARIAKDGRVKTATELELLVRVLEAAEHSPETLATFALDQVRIAVMEGEGRVRAGALIPGHIGEPEVDLVRRILFAYGGDGGMAVTRAEAEALFAINDALTEGGHCKAWDDLFARAVCNVICAAAPYRPGDAKEAIAREAFLDSRDGVSGFLGKVFGSRKRANEAGSTFEATMAARNAGLAQAETFASRVLGEEAEWLIARITADGRVDGREPHLLRTLRDLSPGVHASLRPYLDEAA